MRKNHFLFIVMAVVLAFVCVDRINAHTFSNMVAT